MWNVDGDCVTAGPPVDPGDEIAHIYDSLPYVGRRRTACRQGHAIDRFVYKYRNVDVNSSESIDRLKDILVRSRLWLSSPKSFNDPFDSRINQVAWTDDVSAREQRFGRLIAINFPDLEPTRHADMIRHLMLKSRQEIEDVTCQANEKLTADLGVYCFAGDPRSILMWSHYANFHKGICLQLEVLRSPLPLMCKAKVIPVDAYPISNWFDEQDQRDAEKSVFAKFSEWKYENESRVVVLDGANKWLKFCGNACTGVILGCAIEEETLAVLRDVLALRSSAGLPDLKVYQAERHSSAYKLVIRNSSAMSQP